MWVLLSVCRADIENGDSNLAPEPWHAVGDDKVTFDGVGKNFENNFLKIREELR